MKAHHHMLFSHFIIFTIGMVLGVTLARNSFIWIGLIILVALALGFIGKSTMKKPRRRRLPRMQERNG